MTLFRVHNFTNTDDISDRHTNLFDNLQCRSKNIRKTGKISFSCNTNASITTACNSTSFVFSETTGWPPSPQTEGQVALIAGFPKILREVGSRNIEAGPYSTMFRVASVNEGYYCQIVQEELISFDGGPSLHQTPMLEG